MFVNSRRGRVRSKAYSAWRIEAGWVLNGSGARPVASPVAITMRFGKLNSASDLGNREKGITDLLVTHKLIEDDSVKHVRRILLEYEPDNIPAGYVAVSIVSL